MLEPNAVALVSPVLVEAFGSRRAAGLLADLCCLIRSAVVVAAAEEPSRRSRGSFEPPWLDSGHRRVAPWQLTHVAIAVV